jgi:peptidoglycan/LPS O-acetylase OafA/YrhL
MPDKLERLQAARAIAALSVAYFHSYIALRAFPESAQIPIGPLKEWGYFGVNFFFSISGYVICPSHRSQLFRHDRLQSSECFDSIRCTGLRWRWSPL